jgi:hypothetical protein
MADEACECTFRYVGDGVCPDCEIVSEARRLGFNELTNVTELDTAKLLVHCNVYSRTITGPRPPPCSRMARAECDERDEPYPSARFSIRCSATPNGRPSIQTANLRVPYEWANRLYRGCYFLPMQYILGYAYWIPVDQWWVDNTEYERVMVAAANVFAARLVAFSEGQEHSALRQQSLAWRQDLVAQFDGMERALDHMYAHCSTEQVATVRNENIAVIVRQVAAQSAVAVAEWAIQLAGFSNVADGDSRLCIQLSRIIATKGPRSALEVALMFARERDMWGVHDGDPRQDGPDESKFQFHPAYNEEAVQKDLEEACNFAEVRYPIPAWRMRALPAAAPAALPVPAPAALPRVSRPRRFQPQDRRVSGPLALGNRSPLSAPALRSSTGSRRSDRLK